MKIKNFQRVIITTFILFFGFTGMYGQQTKVCNAASNNTTVTAKQVVRTITEADLGVNTNSYGTFQFIISSNAPSKELFTDDVLNVIEMNRLQDRENMITISQYTKVRILSKEMISSPGFKPLEKLYVIE